VFSIFKNRWFLALVGLLLLALIIWFGGPYIAIAEAKPLDGVTGRLIAIIALMVLYALLVTIKQLRSKKASQKLAAGAAKQEDSAGGAKGSAGGGEALQLRKRFEEATEALKKSKKGGRNLYELPWYIIIGPPGSGKTTVLMNSGLNFPLAKSFGKEALRGVGGTRNCDWWFTDEAILLDTAGRYTTQDSGAQADAAGWNSFLQLLRKYRRRQPINGVILAISAADLLTLSEKDRDLHVSAIRERLDELNKQLKITPPVYVLVTKCDLIAGFSEFFDEIGQEGRAQVWGATFPIEASETGRAPEAFDTEFDQLLQRIQARVIPRLEQERDTRRRVTMLAFPQQLASLKPMLGEVLRRIFSATEFDSRVMLRGFYLTSGTQEGMPIDRMLGAIARSFGFAGTAAAAPSGAGKAYFIERLLKQVIFRESGLAGVNRRLQIQKALAQSAAYIACVAVLILGLVYFIVSYRANSRYVAEVTKATEILNGTQVPAGAGLDVILPRLDALRAVTQAAEAHKDGVPWSMRAGLYQGRSLTGAASDAYAREINTLLLPILARQFEQRIVVFAGQPDRLYEYLKGYLMLGDAEHRDPDHLRFLSQYEWRQLAPNDADARDRLAQHLEQLLSDPGRFKSVPISADVVAQARFALQTASLPVLMYSRLKLTYLGDQKRAIRLDLKLGPGADAVLYRKSGAKLSDPIPAIYTRPAFNEINATGKYELIKQFAADRWVFADNAFDLKNAPKLANQVMQVYEQDYIRFWDDTVADVRLKPSSGQQQLSEAISTLSGPTSPLKGFYAIVADNTDLLKPDESLANKAVGGLAANIAAKAGALTKMFGDDTAAAGQEKPGTKVAAHFEPIRKLTDGPPGGAPIDRVLVALGQVNQVLKSASGSVGTQSTADPAVLKAANDAQRNVELESKDLPAGIGAMLADVGSRALGVVKGAASGELGRKYDEFVAKECHALIDGRYPFTRASPTDLPMDDFAHLFADGGTFDKFFRENLAQLVDTSRSPWRWKEGAAQVAGARGLLGQFQAVQAIREIYFKAGAKPEIRFNITPDLLDAAVSRFSLDVDGQNLEYRHGPLQSSTFSWPGSGAGHATVTFDSGPTPSITAFQGPWAWFRVLDQTKILAQSETRFLVTFSQGGHSARLVIEATSVRNPFARNEVQSFRCSS
jgi:type VI secretion system protein ImpL